MDTLPIGYRLNSPIFTYTIEEVLGHGNFGITYKASAVVKMGNIETIMSFAIKEYFRNGLCMRENDTKRVSCTTGGKKEVEDDKAAFRHEGKILQQLCQNSPYIVKVNEVFDANNTVYYVMQYLTGGNLRELVGHTPMAEEDAKGVLRCIASATQILHNQKLLHLDIKPDNVVMTTGLDGKFIPVLIDFGLAKHFDKNGHPTTKSSTSGYTDGYAPIEQYGGIKTFSPTADVYALGATFYFMLTGKDPMRAFDLKLERLDLPDKVTSVSREALCHALAKNYYERTPSAQEFLQELGMEVDKTRPEDGGGTVILKEPPKDSLIKKVFSLIKRRWLLILTILACITAFYIIKTIYSEKEPNPVEIESYYSRAEAESYICRLNIILNEEFHNNVDSLIAAYECLNKLDSLGATSNPMSSIRWDLYYEEVDELTNKLFDEIVANGDESSIVEVKRNCYRKALRLKDDPETREKLRRLELEERRKHLNHL